ncbi:hypothetical protein EPUS_01855 [Endocarpon pusillum Z07020]|uniref:RNase III domain-containing protein n=1 Tax=Endocarpon pusillum (strain Z07020 / HMAS-L-300199) TaxID=1263415 RepID=U1GCV2_ENDPU|nr:uncharacterized protein EPUS_01855 [Endocarpon pusillum Z07020]ERF69526.1 hypothetical protein EPUS_01855 [Endocarpon pusillum Z07020]
MHHPSMLPKVDHCQEILKYQFKDRDLCWEALQMAGSGVRSAGSRSIPNGNKRLAIVGDFVLDLILSKDWYDSGALEGTWDNIRQSVVSNAMLGRVGTSSDLVKCIELPNGQKQASSKMMATTVEAVIGAVYLDAGPTGLAAAGNVMQELGIEHGGHAI